MSTYTKAIEWIEYRRDREQVIATDDCRRAIKSRSQKEVQRAFCDALKLDMIGWDQRCYYTIPRTGDNP
jgi:hypothetical protein